MRLKVKHAIKGLVPGDILTYNEKDASYEIWKIEEDISDKGNTKKTLKVTIGDWLVNDYKEYLDYIDDDGNVIQVEEFEYKEKGKPVQSTETIEDWKSECIKLSNRIIELEKQLDEYRQIAVYTIYPKRRSFFEPINIW
jgi:serine protease inhibitor